MKQLCVEDCHDLDSLRHRLEKSPIFKSWLLHTNLGELYGSASINDKEILLNALFHSSFVNENTELIRFSNERLEFLGDAFLDAEISMILYQSFPQLTEGPLSKIRSSIVNEDILAQWALELHIDQVVFIGKGEKKKDYIEPAILADTFEAIIGAIGLLSYSNLRTLLEKWIKIYDDTRPASEIKLIDPERLILFDPKTRLQEKTLELFKALPKYFYEEVDGGFIVSIEVQEKKMASAFGKSKKKAEVSAAKEILLNKKIDKIAKELLTE